MGQGAASKAAAAINTGRWQQECMRKYSTNYFKWTIDFVIQLFVLTILVFAIYKGLTYDKTYSMDLTGHTITILSVVLLGLFLWETTILFDFIIKDINADIYLNSTDLRISKSGKDELLSLKDLKEIEYVGPRTGSKSITSYLAYCKLTFTKKVVILTSFTISNSDIAKQLGHRSTRTINKERRFFELIK